MLFHQLQYYLLDSITRPQRPSFDNCKVSQHIAQVYVHTYMWIGVVPLVEML